VLVLLLSVRTFAQQVNHSDSLAVYNHEQVNLKPQLHYSLGSTFTVIPHYGTIAGIEFTPFLLVPVTPKLSFEGGIAAGRYYSAVPNLNPEGAKNSSFNELSIWGSASYHVNPQLTIYGAGIKKLVNTSPYNYLPDTRYTIGSTYRFGNFSIGASVEMSKWDNSFNPLPINSSRGFHSPYSW